MTQKADVLELRGKNAVVSVKRASMCEGCEKKSDCGTSCLAGDLLGANQTMTAVASNEIGAKAGDVVEIESESRTVLGYAALIFLFPIFLCAAAYGIARQLGFGETGSMIAAGIGFIVSFLFIVTFDRFKKKRARPDIRITRIL